MKFGFKRAFLVSTIAAIIIAVSMTVINPSDWRRLFCISFIYSYLISSMNNLLYRISGKLLDKLSGPQKLFTTVIRAILGTSIASFFGIMLDHILFGAVINFVYIRDVLILNFTIVSIILGFAAVFLSLELKNERIAAQLQQKEIEKKKLEVLKLHAELEALQTKINPHFLFNTLNSIASLIPLDPVAAESMVEKLSALFRYTLLKAGNAIVPLSEEIDIVRSYLEIEKLRFGKRLEYEISVAPDVEDAGIPALLIQPLVENSIKYAIGPDIKGGLIEIEIKRKDNNILIDVKDSGKGFTEDGSAGFGLKSIRERLSLLYKEYASLEIFHDGKTNVLITLPFEEKTQ